MDEEAKFYLKVNEFASELEKSNKEMEGIGIALGNILRFLSYSGKGDVIDVLEKVRKDFEAAHKRLDKPKNDVRDIYSSISKKKEDDTKKCMKDIEVGKLEGYKKLADITYNMNEIDKRMNNVYYMFSDYLGRAEMFCKIMAGFTEKNIGKELKEEMEKIKKEVTGFYIR